MSFGDEVLVRRTKLFDRDGDCNQLGYATLVLRAAAERGQDLAVIAPLVREIQGALASKGCPYPPPPSLEMCDQIRTYVASPEYVERMAAFSPKDAQVMRDAIGLAQKRACGGGIPVMLLVGVALGLWFSLGRR